MKRIGILVIALVVSGLFVCLPRVSFAYEATAYTYAADGRLISAVTRDKSNNNYLVNEMFYKANGQRENSLDYTEGLLSFTTKFNYAVSGKILSSNYTSKDGSVNMTTLYDGSGQGILTLDNKVSAVGGNYWLFLGDTDNDGGFRDKTTVLSTQEDAGAAILSVLAKLAGGPTVNNSNVDTHSKFNFALITGAIVANVNVDTNGDGLVDTNYGFRTEDGTAPAWTANQWASGSGEYALYATSKTVTNAAGKIVGEPLKKLADPTGHHNDGHWDPAVTFIGTLGKDNNGFYVIDGDGARHNLDVGDANIANQLSANIGATVSVTGDHADDDPGATTIFLQNFEAVG